jgi:proline iminopeptidase
VEPYPPIEPYDSGVLDVGDENSIYWEVCGNPAGQSALVVHGGPGSGASRGSARLFDPERYRVVLFDQRGCGRSRPHASDPTTKMAVNTTRHLVADMEQLREHLEIDAWLLYGGSWGSTLVLVYAEQHPERVKGVVIAGVTMTRPSETDWLYRGVARFLPAQWERFRSFAGSDDVVRAYARLMEDPDLKVRQRAAAEWVAWEDAVIAHETKGSPGAYRARVDDARLAFVRICTHYFAHDAWLEDDELLRNAHLLRRIPGVLIHGRLDLGSPLRTAWELQRAWPAAYLVVIDDDGHTGGDATRSAVLIATERFAQTS